MSEAPRREGEADAGRKTGADGIRLKAVLMIAGLGYIILIASVAFPWLLVEKRRSPAQPAAQLLAPTLSKVERTLITSDVRSQKFREGHKALLSSYAWTDREHGIARIPVDQAMQIYLEKSK